MTGCHLKQFLMLPIWFILFDKNSRYVCVCVCLSILIRAREKTIYPSNVFYTTLQFTILSLSLSISLFLQALFLRRMSSPGKSLTHADDTVIKAIVDVLSAEEQKLGLQQPVGGG